jgi:BirA family biotin operon repressor/biotin-[acetyl-CoA-carboxylase] ligase
MNIPEPLFTGKNTIFLEEIPSTNTYAMEIVAKTNPPEGTCIYTAYQSAGRGQIGRFWHSSKYKNILSSYIFYPKQLQISDQFLLNIISGLAVKDVVSEFIENVKIKWPNDIYVGDKKIAGILVQNILRGAEIKATVIGIGLNVNEDFFPSDIPNPISLTMLTNINHDIPAILQLLSARIEYYYMKMKVGQQALMETAYTNALYRLNEKALFIKEDKTTFSGYIQGVDTQGKLLIKMENGEIMAFGFREIVYVI